MRINKKILEFLILPAVLIVLLFIPHLFSFDNDYVDLEPLNVRTALEIAENGLSGNLTAYFTDIVNPLLTPMILSASYKLFWESPVVSRVTIFLLAFIFSIFLYFYLRNKEGTFGAFLPALLVTVNPLFIVYSQYICSDVPFMIFSSTAVLLFLYSISCKGKILSSIVLGISLATKYTTVLLFPVVVIYSFIKSKITSHFSWVSLYTLIRFNLWYFILALLVSAPVLFITFQYLSGVVPATHRETLVLSAGLYIPRFFGYLMWLGLLIGPFFLIFVLDLWKRIGKTKFFILLAGLVVLTFIVTYFFPISNLHALDYYFGEMNLGGIEGIIPEPYLSVALFLVLLVAEVSIAGIIFDIIQTRDEKVINLFLWIIIPILLMSLTRAANRYMFTVLVPLSLYMSVVTERIYSGRMKPFVLAILVLHALIFISVGFYAVY